MCKVCKKQINARFELCWACHQNQKAAESYREYLAKSPEQRADELEAYYNRLCSMCGKEGADYHGETLFCGTCWTIWNS